MRVILGNKGLSVNDLTGVVITLVLIAAFISVGLLVNSSLYKTFPAGSVVNESVTYTNLTITPPSCTPVLSVSRIMNTSHELLPANWTFDDWGVNLTIRTLGADAGLTYVLPWKTTYTCSNSSAYLAMANSTKSLSVLAQWLPIIAVVIAASIVIAAIFSWVYSKREL